MAENNLSVKQVVEAEKAELKIRREKIGITDSENWFGLALSGGGIRSATINLGFLKTLNKFGILERADWLSTVSGGGYCGSFVQTTLRSEGNFETLFADEKMEALRNHGDYMIPGTGFSKHWNRLLLMMGWLVSTVLSLVSPATVILAGICIYRAIGCSLNLQGIDLQWIAPGMTLLEVVGWSVVAVLAAHFVANVFLNFNLDISKFFNHLENVLALVCLVLGLVWLVSSYKEFVNTSNWSAWHFLAAAAGLFLAGFLTNPNALSFHRYYRKQLADCYLQFAKGWRNVPLKNLFDAKSSDRANWLAPYPLVNTCLNLQAPTGDDKFKGAKASDYFLLSPLFCGSKLTGYVPTDRYADYKSMTLPAAATISAAAVNPGMGIYSSKPLAVLMTIFNARLGFWISNPLKINKLSSLIWWPIYFFKELFSLIGTGNKMVNISDGGHIENLAVYELLRRRCRLIIGVDAGEDAFFGFGDLENLVIRARNELGIEFRWKDGQEPEYRIRPRPSHGYSPNRFAVAELFVLWENRPILDESGQQKVDEHGKKCTRPHNFESPIRFGTFVYVKSSVTAPRKKPDLTEEKDTLKFDTWNYKIYHPAFPHESTGDQFFDRVQWESYFQLGQHLAADVLDLQRDPGKVGYGELGKLSVDELTNHFDNGVPLFMPTVAVAASIQIEVETSQNESFEMPPEELIIQPAASVSMPKMASPAPAAEAEYRM